ncbi:MAG TPA: Nramp family divalent metal transporter [Gaiellaceae bacterium]|nr:Nramp family divalent metal transporter [Gaiellaceae bacterium]
MIATRAAELPEGLRTVDEALHRTRFRILPFLGPAFIACVAYIDPGNFATNIAGGSKFGYQLVWVIVAANLLAMLIQTLSAKLGIATGRNLPEVARERLGQRATILLWLQAEAIAMATDLAEFLGAAIGFHLLFGFGLFPSAVLTGIAAFAILGLQRFGFRPLEAVIAVLVGVIGVCYLAELTFAHPDYGQVLHHAVVPQFGSGEAVLLSVGILGATVMPHVIYLHSALTQDRLVPETDEDARTLLRYTRVDVIIAMSIAGLINVSMLVMAASTFFQKGLLDVDSLDGAHKTLEPILGGASSALFALALLASGLSSSAVGTLSGQVVMQGFIRRKIPLMVRRFVTMLPAFVVIAIGIDPSRTLVLSQVVLSFGIPFALVPLVYFTARRDIMGALVNRRITTVAASAIAAVIIGLNIFLLAQTAGL